MDRSESNTPQMAASAAGSAQWLAALTRLVKAIGTEVFETDLLGLLNTVAPVDYCVVFTCDQSGSAGHLFTHGHLAADTAHRLAEDYVKRYHADDPNYQKVLAGQSTDELIPLDLDSHYDAAYRNHFFDRVDLVDKASTISKVEHGSVYCNFYRMGRSGRYSAADWELLEQVLPLLTSLIAQHYEILQLRGSPQAGSARSMVHNIISKNHPPFTDLTRREREVCERIVLGYTSVGIGLDLNIAPSSVITYRRRAYQKLGIASQNELFSLCLQASARA